MMDFKMNNGSIVIDDNNQVHVDKKTAKDILKAFDTVEENKDKKKPDMIIKD